MNNLRKRFERFCFKHRDKGIPTLMLYIVLGNALVIIMSMINGGGILYELLRFDKGKILQGQVWRLVTYVFTQSGSSFLELIFLYFFYMLGRYVESSMGTFKFNLYYLSGVLLMDIFAMIFCPTEPVMYGGIYYAPEAFTALYSGMAYYLHLSLILTFATTHPDSQFMIFFIIPVKAWLIALVYLIIELVAVFNLSYPVMYFPHNLFPLVALGNYFLFMGSDILGLIPLSARAKVRRLFRKKPKKAKVVPFPGANQTAAQSGPYNHRCTVCGRTDVDHPELEFRYCSRCAGYHCYCQDHISNHEHIQ